MEISCTVCENIPSDLSPIIGSYLIIQDNQHRVCVEYTSKGWCLPFIRNESIHQKYHVQPTKVKLVGFLTQYDTGKIWNIGRLTISAPKNTKYITVYHMNTPFIHFPNIDIINKSSFFNWSKIVKLPIYQTLHEIFDSLYHSSKINLVLDLDSTLLSSYLIENESGNENGNKFPYIMEIPKVWIPDHIMTYPKVCSNDEYLCYIWTRPHLYSFLDHVSKLTHLSYWTAGFRPFQEKVIQITGLDRYTKHYFFSEHCTQKNGFIFKNLSLLPFYQPDKTLLIDDNPTNHEKNPENSILINSWDITDIQSGSDCLFYQSDNELTFLTHEIEYLSDCVIHNDCKIKDCLKKQKIEI